MLPDDVIAEILQRLPLKSVFKFKCVSKGWNCLISKPSFKRSYELQSQGIGGSAWGFLYHGMTDKDDPSFCFYVGPTRFIGICDRDDQRMPDSFDFIDTLGFVIASCKGLLLVTSPPEEGFAPRYYVCDPLTQKHVALPPTLEGHQLDAPGFLCEESGHYKVVVCTDVLAYQSTHKIETYSSETGQWEKSMISASSKYTLKPFAAAQVMGGVLYYWTTYYGRSTVVAYDPNDRKERVKLIQMPLDGYDEEYDEPIIYHSMGISETKEGHLQYYRIEFDIEIFVLDESTRSWYDTEDVIGHERWNLIHKIDIYELGLDPLKGVCCVGFHPLDPQRIFLEEYGRKPLFSYNYTNGAIDEICSFDFAHDFFFCYQHPLWPCLC